MGPWDHQAVQISQPLARATLSAAVLLCCQGQPHGLQPLSWPHDQDTAPFHRLGRALPVSGLLQEPAIPLLRSCLGSGACREASPWGRPAPE